MIDADYEAALAQLAGMVGEAILVTFHVDGVLVGSNGGELVGAKPLSPGTSEESVIFHLLGGGTFVLDRSVFRRWRLDLDDSGLVGLDLQLAGDAEVRVTRFAAIGLG